MAKKKTTPNASVKSVVRRSRREATREASQVIRRLMCECEGTEWQILSSFNTQLTIELSRIMDRMEKLRPDEWGT